MAEYQAFKLNYCGSVSGSFRGGPWGRLSTQGLGTCHSMGVRAELLQAAGSEAMVCLRRFQHRCSSGQTEEALRGKRGERESQRGQVGAGPPSLGGTGPLPAQGRGPRGPHGLVGRANTTVSMAPLDSQGLGFWICAKNEKPGGAGKNHEKTGVWIGVEERQRGPAGLS